MDLQLKGLHVLVTGADGPIGATVDEFIMLRKWPPFPMRASQSLLVLEGNLTDEAFVTTAFAESTARFGPINVLVVVTTTMFFNDHYPIWRTALGHLDLIYQDSIRESFLVIKHTFQVANDHQLDTQCQLENLAIVFVESAVADATLAERTTISGSLSMLHGFLQALKRDLEYLNTKATINVLARVSHLEDVGRAIATVASHNVTGHLSGQYLNVRRLGHSSQNNTEEAKRLIVEVDSSSTPISKPFTMQHKHRVRVALSVDFDAISAHLGTGKHPDNNMSDYSAGIFAGKVGALRLLRLFKRLDLADKMTWFIPGHSMETFPAEVKQIVESGSEIGLHGYSHEGAYQMSEEQESDVLQKCIDLATQLTGKKPIGYRAPLYQIRETTIPLLEKYGFKYDSSLTHHDSQPYRLALTLPIHPPDFSKPASTWMHPTPLPSSSYPSDNKVPFSSLIEIPCNWYGEDETPLSYLPHVPNSHGYVDVRVIEQMWKDRFMWLWEHAHEEQEGTEGKEGITEFIFPMVLHPDTSGMAHVIGMVERFLKWLRGWGPEVEFWRYEDIAREARAKERPAML
ncbi:MAG: hypothetical protein Q9170_004897 [Blastenia crenularia]